MFLSNDSHDPNAMLVKLFILCVFDIFEGTYKKKQNSLDSLENHKKARSLVHWPLKNKEYKFCWAHKHARARTYTHTHTRARTQGRKKKVSHFTF